MMSADMRSFFLMVWVVLLATSAFSQTENDEQTQTGLASDSIINEGYFIGADDVRLFYRKVGSGKDIVMSLHGGAGSNLRRYGDRMGPLASRRTVRMYDQLGS